MAEHAERKQEPPNFTKGMQLTIVIEDVFNGVLVVLLEHKGHVFRGVLLDAKQKSQSSGVFSALCNQGADGASLNKDMKYLNNLHMTDHFEEKPVDVPATVFRHTYFQNTSPFNSSQLNAPLPKIGGNKHTRNIRLRPRQTLCSKCKSTCLDSDKGPIPVASAIASLSQTRKREKELESELKPAKLIKVNNDVPKLTRTSPFIKISIGDNNVMNIPPRLQESEREELSSEAEKATDVDDLSHIESALHNEEDEEDNEVIFNFKPSLLRQRKEKLNCGENRKKRSCTNNLRRNKRSKHKQDSENSDSEMLPNIIITENSDSEQEKNELLHHNNSKRRRPRLVYTLHQTKGLSTVNDQYSGSGDENVNMKSSQNTLSTQLENLDGTSLNEPNHYRANRRQARKKYKLRSRSQSAGEDPEFELSVDTSSSSEESESVKLTGDNASGCVSDSECSDYGEGPPGDENEDCLKPLMMKIHTTTVPRCSTADGRKLCVEDIVWGKIKGFPWWPGRVMTINISQKDNGVVIRQIAQVAWFGSSTMSHIPCSDLYPFLDDFKVRFNRKKKSTPYRRAIKQATMAAQSCPPAEDVELHDIDYTGIS